MQPVYVLPPPPPVYYSPPMFYPPPMYYSPPSVVYIPSPSAPIYAPTPVPTPVPNPEEHSESTTQTDVVVVPSTSYVLGEVLGAVVVVAVNTSPLWVPPLLRAFREGGTVYSEDYGYPANQAEFGDGDGDGYNTRDAEDTLVRRARDPL